MHQLWSSVLIIGCRRESDIPRRSPTPPFEKVKLLRLTIPIISFDSTEKIMVLRDLEIGLGL